MKRVAYAVIVSLVAGVLSLGLAVLGSSPATAADTKAETKSLDCKLEFTLKGWSAFYKTAKGEGTIKCTDGQSLPVSIKSTGGGLSFGTQEILNGVGDFSDVNSLDELLGSYAAGEANAGAGKAATAQVVTKGEVSLALSGTGEGVNLGISFGKFTIKKR